MWCVWVSINLQLLEWINNWLSGRRFIYCTLHRVRVPTRTKQLFFPSSYSYWFKADKLLFMWYISHSFIQINRNHVNDFDQSCKREQRLHIKIVYQCVSSLHNLLNKLWHSLQGLSLKWTSSKPMSPRKEGPRTPSTAICTQ